MHSKVTNLYRLLDCRCVYQNKVYLYQQEECISYSFSQNPVRMKLSRRPIVSTVEEHWVQEFHSLYVILQLISKP